MAAKASIYKELGFNNFIEQRRQLFLKELRFCVDCKVVKNLKEFQINRRIADGISTSCKVCKNKKSKLSLQLLLSDKLFSEKRKVNTKKYSAEYRKKRPMYSMFHGAKRRSIKGGLPFDLTIDFLEKLLISQGNVCAFSGLPFHSGTSVKNRNPRLPSLDRIIPRHGYVKGNVRIILYAINTALSDWGDQVYFEIAKASLAHKSRKS